MPRRPIGPTLGTMTTTTSFDTDPQRPPAPPHVLRRSRTNRVGAGVAAGLGDYFGVDPVLFRVLFATAAFFGGAGIVAYVIAWAAIPEEGTERAPIDGWLSRLRRGRVPVWVVAVAAGVLLWLLAFSWWVPRFFLPVVVVVTVLAIAFSRQGRSAAPTAAPAGPAPASAPGGPVDLTKPLPAEDGAEPTAPGQPAAAGAPAWREGAAAWAREAKAASALRRRRAAPVRIAVIVVLVVTLGAIGAADAARGVLLAVYFWVTLGIVGAGLLVGMALRRTPWSVGVLLVPAVAGLVAFSGTRASLHDGIGGQTWLPAPTATAASTTSYRLAFGQGVLDLRGLPTQTAPRTIDITMAAGQVRILAPKHLNVVVDAAVRFGAIDSQVEQRSARWQPGDVMTSGFGRSLQLPAPAGATGAPITVSVHLADGEIDVRRTR